MQSGIVSAWAECGIALSETPSGGAPTPRASAVAGGATRVPGHPTPVTVPADSPLPGAMVVSELPDVSHLPTPIPAPELLRQLQETLQLLASQQQ